MRRIKACAIMLWIVFAASASRAMDVYDWRASAERTCSQSFSMLERQILGYMAGGRPENPVIEKLKDSVPHIQDIGGIDAAAAQIVVKSLVHSFFSDPELRLPFFTIKSVQNARKSCAAAVLRYDPDGRKAEAYQNIKGEQQRREREQEEREAQEREKREQDEERARLEDEKKQEEENKARAAEEARVRLEKENARLEEERRVRAEEDTRMQRDADRRRAEVAERQRQHEAAIQDMLKNTRTDEDVAREEAERRKKEEEDEEAKKANSGLGGFIKSLW